jgi:hypothetical protein
MDFDCILWYRKKQIKPEENQRGQVSESFRSKERNKGSGNAIIRGFRIAEQVFLWQNVQVA